LFRDDDGSLWLYWKSDENAIGRAPRIWTQRLSADATELVGSAIAVLSQDAAWERPVVENPSLARRGGTSYLFYRGGEWDSAAYAIGYAVGTSPAGGFVKQTNASPWLASIGDALGPGGLDVFTGPDGTTWAGFHVWSGVVSAGRMLRIARLTL
jgi:hypothetical protein